MMYKRPAIPSIATAKDRDAGMLDLIRMLAMPRKYHKVSRHCNPPVGAATGISRGVSLHTLHYLGRTMVRCARRRRVWDEVGWWNGLPLRSSGLFDT